ncbi:MAG TPA: AtpZ/AtpI family protein [bacterium]|nr:AtpZ/AtpI family protein [bacterium]
MTGGMNDRKPGSGRNGIPGGTWGRMGVYAGLGIELPAAILIGVFLGMWIGSFWNRQDTGAVIGLGFGIAAAVRSMLRVFRIWKNETR